jgi:hypothetical protein
MRNSIVFLFLCLFPLALFGLENLDELETRSSRKSTNTFYSGENSGNYYIWQPQTVVYNDTATDHEIIIWSQTDDVDCMDAATEYGWRPWSADGKRIAVSFNKDVGSYTRSTGSPWFVAKSDGSYMRPFAEGPARTTIRQQYFDWSPTEPDTAYQLGRNRNGVTGLDANNLYKVTVTDTGGSYTSWVDTLTDDTSEALNGMKGAISMDGKYMVLSINGSEGESAPFYFVQLAPYGSGIINWSISDLSLDTSWTGTSAADHLHDEYFIGNSITGYWLEFYWASPNNCHWRARMQGSDNGTPTHTSDSASYDTASGIYDWWGGMAAQTEVQPLSSGMAGTRAWPQTSYWSHHSWDPWGRCVAFAYANGSAGAAVCDINRFSSCATTGCADYVATDYVNSGYGGCQYTSWGAWTDYPVFTVQTDGTAIATQALIKKWNETTSHLLCDLHSSITGDFAHPGLSPDGTKSAIRSDWLNPTNGQSDLFIIVDYYPHPPEITSCTQSGGTVTVTFEWMLDTTPRGYTSRGWPDESTNNPPPPRETKKFRLWRSADKATWTPLGTVDAEIFTRYDFATGVWSGNDYWTITDTPGAGTWYYAVTSVEWSGLESHCLSNIYAITIGSGNGVQDTAYPASPGDLDNIATSDFHTSFVTESKSIIRHYNIYAEDGSAPTVSQTNRIATIPVSACSDGSCSWVDWLGATDGSTQYVVTAVDTQGNESNSTFVTTQSYSALETDGQYSITWDDMYEAYDDGGLVSGSSTTVSGTVNWH